MIIAGSLIVALGAGWYLGWHFGARHGRVQGAVACYWQLVQKRHEEAAEERERAELLQELHEQEQRRNEILPAQHVASQRRNAGWQ